MGLLSQVQKVPSQQVKPSLRFTSLLSSLFSTASCGAGSTLTLSDWNLIFNDDEASAERSSLLQYPVEFLAFVLFKAAKYK